MLVQSNSWNSVHEFAEGHGQQIKSNQCCGMDNTYKVTCQCAAEHKQKHAPTHTKYIMLIIISRLLKADKI